MGIDLDRAPQITRNWWIFGHLTIWPAVRGAMRLSVRGREHLPREGAVLVVCNHISQVDPPILGVAALPRKSYYMAKIELFRPPILREIIYNLGAFPVDRGASDRRALRIARDILARGDQLLMFPEGTRSRNGRLGAPFPGAGTLGLRPGVTVVPAAIWGSQRPFGKVRVAFGPPLDFSDLGDGPKAERSQRAAQRMMAAIGALLPSVGGPNQEPAR